LRSAASQAGRGFEALDQKMISCFDKRMFRISHGFYLVYTEMISAYPQLSPIAVGGDVDNLLAEGHELRTV
jgi:hypothetical protein